MNKDKQAVFAEVCKQQGWKCTAQRMAIYHFMAENYSHPGIDAAWEYVKQTLPTVTRESVYRIFNEFADAGIIQRLDHLSSARYDCQTLPHGHFVCTVCGQIIDFALQNKVALPKDLAAGEVHHIELRASGVCHKCTQIKKANF